MWPLSSSLSPVNTPLAGPERPVGNVVVDARALDAHISALEGSLRVVVRQRTDRQDMRTCALLSIGDLA